MNNNPNIKVERSQADKFLDTIGLIGAVLLILIPLIYYQFIPVEIPTLFDLNGEVVKESDKSTIWTLALTGLISFFLLYFLVRQPNKFNYPIKVTEENAQELYSYSATMARKINALTVWLMVFITYGVIQVALGNWTELPFLVVLVFLAVILSIVFSGFKKMSSLKN